MSWLFTRGGKGILRELDLSCGSTHISLEGQTMRIRLEHQSVLDGRYHVITSPDVPGLYVTGGSRNEAMQELVQVLPRIQAIRGGLPEEEPIAIEYAQAPV